MQKLLTWTIVSYALLTSTEGVAQVETSTRAAEPPMQAEEPKAPAETQEPKATTRTDEPKAAAKPVVETTTRPHGPIRGFDVIRGSEIFRLRIGATVQLDARFFPGSDDRRPTDTFFPGRIRPIFEGDLWKFVTFRLMPDFGAGRGVTLEEAWVDLELHRALHIRFGKDKVGYGLERLQTETDIIFVERSQVTQLVPNRDTGLQIKGAFFNDAVSYSIGLWDGVPDGANATAGDGDLDRKKDISGRIFIRPFRLTSIELLHEVGLGIAGTHGVRRGTSKAPQLPAFKTAAQQNLFTFNADANATAAGTAVANGQLDRYSPQLYVYIGPVGLMAEYAKTTQDVLQGNNQATLIHDAYEATLSVAITGEKESYYGIAVERPASLDDFSLGAIELALRYDHSNYSKAALGTYADGNKNWNGSDAFWAGINWYLNDNVKLSGDFVHSSFNGNAPKLLDHEDAVLLLTQLAI